MGQVERILLRPDAEGVSHDVERATAVAGRGLEGDRYHASQGTFYADGKDGQDLTLIAAEALEGLRADTGIDLPAEEAGRNLVTRGVDLDALLGRRFRIGDVECVGRRPCEPCATLARRTEPGVLRGLAGRGGLRADIVSGGEIAVGDGVVSLD